MASHIYSTDVIALICDGDRRVKIERVVALEGKESPLGATVVDAMRWYVDDLVAQFDETIDQMNAALKLMEKTGLIEQ